MSDSYESEIKWWESHLRAGQRAVEVATRELERIQDCIEQSLGETALRGADEMLAGQASTEIPTNRDWPQCPQVDGSDV